MKHHKYSPSSLSAVQLCPARVKLQEEAKKKGYEKAYSEEAVEGTFLHECVKDGTVEGCTPFQAELVSKCTALVKERFDEGICHFEEIEVEVKADGKVLTFGTCDKVILHKEDAVLIDWKFGYMETPSASENLQLATYAVGIHQKFDVPMVDVHIYNPRLNIHTSYKFRNFDTILEHIHGIIMKAEEEEPLVNPGGTQCKYCMAKPVCPALQDTFFMLANAEKATFKDKLSLVRDPDTLSDYYEKCQIVKDYISEIEKHCKAVAVDNNNALGKYVVQERRGKAEITEPEEVMNLLMGALPTADILRCVTISASKFRDMWNEFDVPIDKFIKEGKINKYLRRVV